MKKYRIYLWAMLICAMALFLAAPSHAVTKDWFIAEVAEQPYDGDTIKVKMPYPFLEMSIRIKGLDTPEMASKTGRWAQQPGGIMARDKLREVIKPGDWVWIKFQSWSYGRMVAAVRFSTPNMNSPYQDVHIYMLKRGLAHIDKRFTPRSDPAWEVLAIAIKEKRGIYAAGMPHPCPPSLWRKNACKK